MTAENIEPLSIHVKGKDIIVENWAAGNGITMPVLLDLKGEVSDLYNVTHVPTSFLLNPGGIIQAINPAFNNPEELKELFQSYLDSSNP